MDEAGALSKKEELIRRLQAMDSLVVAYSGGVDSTFLLAAAHQALGKKVVAVTASSPAFPGREQEEAARFASDWGIEHVVFPSEVTALPRFVANGPDRCYWCKRSFLQKIQDIARELGIRHIADASNLDDLDDYRPGMRAAEEAGIETPLIDVGLAKEEIRFLSRAMGLSSWDKPSAACLASRIPYGDPVTEDKLRMVEGCEDFLLKRGFRQCRVRHHGPVARIELPEGDMERIFAPDLRREILAYFRKSGFLHVALDLEGFVSGSLNRALHHGD